MFAGDIREVAGNRGVANAGPDVTGRPVQTWYSRVGVVGAAHEHTELRVEVVIHAWESNLLSLLLDSPCTKKLLALVKALVGTLLGLGQYFIKLSATGSDPYLRDDVAREGRPYAGRVHLQGIVDGDRRACPVLESAKNRRPSRPASAP